MAFMWIDGMIASNLKRRFVILFVRLIPIYVFVLLQSSCSQPDKKSVPLPYFGVSKLKQIHLIESSIYALEFSYLFYNDTIYIHRPEGSKDTWFYTVLKHKDFMKFRMLLLNPKDYELLVDSVEVLDESTITCGVLVPINYTVWKKKTFCKSSPLNKFYQFEAFMKNYAKSKAIEVKQIPIDLVKWEKENIEKSIKRLNCENEGYYLQKNINFLEQTIE
ncbi:MAG: hypothetical protein IT221_02295 [Fluviicola sp.]|nr:hypothetical protein [Fluviicola sp.]